MKQHFISIIAVFILISCSSSNTFLTPEYENMEIKDKSLSIQFDFNNMKVVGFDSDNNEFDKSDFIKIYKNFIEEFLLKFLKQESTFGKMYVNSIYKAEDLTAQKLKISDEKDIEIYLPKTVEVNSDYDFTLFIEDISISNEYKHISSDLFGAPQFPSNILTHNLEYAIWDNNKSKIVNYGILEVENKGASSDINARSWKEAMQDISRGMVKSSPFEKEFAGNY